MRLARAAACRSRPAYLGRHARAVADVFARLPGLAETPIRVCLRGTDEYVRARPEPLWPPLLDGEAEHVASGLVRVPRSRRVVAEHGDPDTAVEHPEGQPRRRRVVEERRRLLHEGDPLIGHPVREQNVLVVKARVEALDPARRWVPDPGDGPDPSAAPEWSLVIAPTKGTLSFGSVAVGDHISRGTVLAQVRTADGDVAVTAPHSGWLSQWLVRDGDDVGPGQPVLRLAPKGALS